MWLTSGARESGTADAWALRVLRSRKGSCLGPAAVGVCMTADSSFGGASSWASGRENRKDTAAGEHQATDPSSLLSQGLPVGW